MKAERYRPSRLPEELRRAWAALAEENPAAANAFLSFEFAAAAERAGLDAWVAALIEGGRPAAFFPYQFARRADRLLGAAERIGGELSDSFGILARPGFRISPADLLRASGLSTLYFSHLPPGQRAFGLEGESPETGLRIELAEGPGAYWEARRRLRADFVSDTDRQRRQLERTSGARRLTIGPADVAAVEKLIERKRAQYNRTGVGDPLAGARERRLLIALATLPDGPLRGLLAELHAGETWAASHFGLQYAGTLHYQFPVYNLEMAKFSPGRLLLAAMVDESGNQGIRTIDLGAGDTPFKRTFANSEQQYLRGLWRSGSARSLLSHAVRSIQWRVAAGRNQG